ncbi:TPR-like protein [Phaeosphaeriaceae sp. SRC1lsM3a]|nr:TPR-like protein [Stagonospora sp. SRC1lsM3a]
MASISFGDANAGFQASYINGAVNNAFHLPPERPETPPPPSIVIPFARDDDFVDRGTLVDEIHRKCARPDARIALVGLGGVGKSQLAIEHAYSTRDRSTETWVLWVHASNAARFEQSYREIADRVKILGRKEPKADIFKLVHDWLCSSKERWLLVLDNVDDAHFLLDRPTTSLTDASKPLREYLPHCERGSILITTRNEGAARKLVEQRDIIVLEPMSEAQALVLLEKKLGPQEDCSNAAELVVALDCMPLAIVQAAAYIVQRAPRYSVARYLDDYRKSERKRTSLLEYDDGQLRRDWEATNSIIVTWQMSFEYIQQTRRSAAELLSLMSFFDRQGIPEDLLRHRGNREEDDGDEQGPTTGAADIDVEEDDALRSSTSIESEEDTFEDDVVALRNFCFISTETGGMSFEMHALVQLATRTWLTTNRQLEQWKQQFISNLSAAFPTGAYENWAVCRPLFPHAKAAAAQQPEDEQVLVEWASLLYRAAWYAVHNGNAAEAKELAVVSLKIRQKALGQEHEDTWWGMAMVADAYSLRGEWNRAEKLEQEVMETRKKKLGADHPDTLISMGNLASTYWNQGRWDAAEELQVQVMETRKKKLGADHLDTLTSMGNLASIYRDQGRWDTAEELEVEKKLGADHPSTLNSMVNLAFTWKAQGRGEEAIALMRQCIEQRERVLRVDHPDLTSCVRVLEQWLGQ